MSSDGCLNANYVNIEVKWLLKSNNFFPNKMI